MANKRAVCFGRELALFIILWERRNLLQWGSAVWKLHNNLHTGECVAVAEVGYPPRFVLFL